MSLFSEEQTEELKALFKDSVKEAVEAVVKPILDQEASECVLPPRCYCRHVGGC